MQRLSAAAYLGGWVAVLSDATLKDDPATLPWLKQAFQADQQKGRMMALVIDKIYSNDLDEQMQQWV